MGESLDLKDDTQMISFHLKEGVVLRVFLCFSPNNFYIIIKLEIYTLR